MTPLNYTENIAMFIFQEARKNLRSIKLGCKSVIYETSVFFQENVSIIFFHLD